MREELNSLQGALEEKEKEASEGTQLHESLTAELRSTKKAFSELHEESEREVARWCNVCRRSGCGQF